MEFAAGFGLLVRGFRIVYSSRRLAVLGMLPALVTGLLLLAGFVALVVGIDELAAWTTPFAVGWAEWIRVTVRVLAGLAILGAAVAVGVLMFVAITLAIGGPFYEKIAEHVDRTVGGEPVEGPGRPLLLDIGDSLRLIAVSIIAGLGLLGLGFVPVIGQTAVPVLAALLGGWVLSLELVSVVFGPRGLGLADRRKALRSRRTLTLGFGIPAYLLLAIPLVAIFAMPGVVAGGALLGREVRRPGVPSGADPGFDRA